MFKRLLPQADAPAGAASVPLRNTRDLRTGGGFLGRRVRPWIVYLTAFLLPMLIMGGLWAVNQVMPAGKRMILAHDQWHQYYPFYLDLRTRLQEGDSLLHSWTTGMGTSYLPLFAYYLASPLNYLAALLPDDLVMVYYNLTVLIRLGLAGLFFACFLKKTFDRSELSVAFFSTMYALCAFFMGYYWNAIWLDTAALLPLVVLGAFSLLKEGRFVLYTASLALSVFCSYYIGLFTCIFVLLIFIGWHIVNWDDLGGFGVRLLKFAFFSLLAVGMTALLTVPTYLGMQSTSSAVNKFPEDTALNMVKSAPITATEAVSRMTRGDLGQLFSFFGQRPPAFSESRTVSTTWIGTSGAFTALRLGYVREFFRSFRLPLEGLSTVLSNTADGITPTSMEGLPNVFCGFSTLIMALLYLFCRKVPLKERIVMVLLLLFFALSFVLRTLDYIWHGLHFPNMLPYRFSFLWSFVIIFMAFRAYTQLETVRWWRVLLMCIPLGLVLYCVLKPDPDGLVRGLTLGVSAVMVLLLLLHSTRTLRKSIFVWALCALMLGEAVCGAIQGVRRVGTTDSSYYPTKGADTKAVLAVMEEREKNTVDLWRAEVAARQTLNDGTFLGYNGITVFSSAANSKVSQFMQSLGLAASVAGNRYAYQEADPFTNLLLGLKYLIDRNGRFTDPTYFELVAQEGQVMLLQNRRYLPLGIVVRDEALNYEPETKGLPFDRLNQLFRQMTGSDELLYTTVNRSKVEALGEAQATNVALNSFTGSSSVHDESNCVEITFRMPETGHLCIYTKSSNCADLVWFLNGDRQYTFSDKYGCNRYMGLFNKGDEISLRYRGSKNSYSAQFGAAIFRSEVFDAAYQALSSRTMICTLVSDTRIEGAVNMTEAGLVYTSIPYDEGWKLTVDGEKAAITPVGDAMIAFHLDPGLHTVALEFEAPGFSLGLTVSLICLALFLVLLIPSLLLRFTRPPVVTERLSLSDPRVDQPEPEPPTGPFGASDGPYGFEFPDLGASTGTMPALDPTQSWTPPPQPLPGDTQPLPDPALLGDDTRPVAGLEKPTGDTIPFDGLEKPTGDTIPFDGLEKPTGDTIAFEALEKPATAEQPDSEPGSEDPDDDVKTYYGSSAAFCRPAALDRWETPSAPKPAEDDTRPMPALDLTPGDAAPPPVGAGAAFRVAGGFDDSPATPFQSPSPFSVPAPLPTPPAAPAPADSSAGLPEEPVSVDLSDSAEADPAPGADAALLPDLSEPQPETPPEEQEEVYSREVLDKLLKGELP